MESTVFRDLYEALEITSDASAKEIKSSFRKLSLVYHPDKIQYMPNSNELTKRYELITLAYSVLNDPETRREYDQMYYIQKRVSHNFYELKQQHKNFTPKNVSKKDHEDIIRSRHEDLFKDFKERDVKSYIKEREYQETEIQPEKSITKNQITVYDKPEAIIPTNVEKYQDIDNIGEMYNKKQVLKNQFVLDVVVDNFEDKNVEQEEIKYNETTKQLKELKHNDFKTDGDLILNKIIL